jgi:glucan biosynthesis protein C
MDALRASMLIAGVFFHAGMVYRPDLAWRFRDPSDLMFFAWLTDSLHAFRMPAFFTVAGFFCALTFQRNGGIGKLGARLITFGVPFVVMMVAVQPWQYAMELDFKHAFSGFDATFWQNYFRDGEYISHLWFLLNLSFYYIAAWLLITMHPTRSPMAGSWLTAAFRSKTALSAVACLAYLPFLLTLRDAAIGTDYELKQVFQYAPFFVAGYILYRNPQLFERFKRIGLADALFTLLLMLLVSRELHPRVDRLLDILWFYQCGFVLTALCMLLFHKFLDRENRFSRLVSDSGYTIYLFHHFLVVLVATAVAVWLPGKSAVLKYSIVVFVVLLVTIAAHQLLIARYPVLRFMFNGRWSGSAGRLNQGLVKPPA